MTAKVQRELAALKRNVERYAPHVEEKLTRAGAKPDPAVVYSAAKYYPALKKLAQE
ncbi:MAG TPA: hypothetical protein VD840_13180 [Sinorhizobium sp.]|nr:hypothetical protein [Sinorhizobium sp.]